MFDSLILRVLAVALASVPALAQEPVEAAAAATPAGQPVAKELDALRPYALMVGDDAPALAIQAWIKGEPVTGWGQDDVTVVEFWATWCGPCIGGMPHLAKLQKQYEGSGVTVVGVNIWDDPANVVPFLTRPFPDEAGVMNGLTGDEVMQYSVAIETKDDAEDVRSGVMAKSWMQAAGRRGIPSAFIVDRTGKLAWIGHPLEMDAALARIVAGDWDLAVEAAAYARAALAKARLEAYFSLFHAGSFDEAYEAGHALLAGSLVDDADQLNTLAWLIVNPHNKPAQQDLNLALAAALRANQLTDAADPNVLDTLACVCHQRGDLEGALRNQRSAVDKAKGSPLEVELRKRLEEFEAEARDSSGSGADA